MDKTRYMNLQIRWDTSYHLLICNRLRILIMIMTSRRCCMVKDHSVVEDSMCFRILSRDTKEPPSRMLSEKETMPFLLKSMRV